MGGAKRNPSNICWPDGLRFLNDTLSRVFADLSATMINIELILFIANLSLLVFFVLITAVGIWTVRGRLQKKFYSRYPRRLIYLSQLPFTYAWRQFVKPDDLLAFEKARMRLHVFLVVLILLTHLVSFYSYLHVVAQLWLCNMRLIG